MESNGYDFDLFFRLRLCAFHSYLNIHIATAGGNVPTEFYSNPSHGNIRAFIKRTSHLFSLQYKINPSIEEIFKLKAELWNRHQSERNFIKYELNRDAYFQDFIEYAKGGFFSFDRTNIIEDNDERYHLVAYPDDRETPYSGQFLVDKDVPQLFSEPVRFSFDISCCIVHDKGGNLIGVGEMY